MSSLLTLFRLLPTARQAFGVAGLSVATAILLSMGLIAPAYATAPAQSESNSAFPVSPDAVPIEEDAANLKPVPRSPNQVSIVGRAINSLRAKPPVYSDPKAQLSLTAAEQDELRVAIRNSGDPIFVAVLPSQAGRPKQVTESIAVGVAKPGIYVTIVGTVYNAYSTDLNGQQIMIRAFTQARQQGASGVLVRFVELASQELDGTTPEDVQFPVGIAAIVFGGGAIIALGLWWTGRRRESAERDSKDES